jgi:hypothetical protein
MKKGYPRNEDVREAIIEALSKFFDHPSLFPYAVYEILESKGFNTKYLSYKRIWRLYEEMVKKGKIYDVLNVIKENKTK